mmetsp:Transcript_8206/g.19400  ORF Transcript_8206/g.19400 Transcript_8206/m.19400 type:complete len:209 (-) Transcript_8206:101-727(-)
MIDKGRARNSSSRIAAANYHAKAPAKLLRGRPPAQVLVHGHEAHHPRRLRRGVSAVHPEDGHPHPQGLGDGLLDDGRGDGHHQRVRPIPIVAGERGSLHYVPRHPLRVERVVQLKVQIDAQVPGGLDRRRPHPAPEGVAGRAVDDGPEAVRGPVDAGVAAHAGRGRGRGRGRCGGGGIHVCGAGPVGKDAAAVAPCTDQKIPVHGEIN